MTDGADSSRYLKLFLEEGEGYLETFSASLARLEQDPNAGRGSIDELFRTAHSLKGMSAMLGFDGMALLSHELEDLLELLRREGSVADRSSFDALFAALEALESGMEQIAATGDETATDTSRYHSVIETLRGLTRRGEASESESSPAAHEPTPSAAWVLRMQLDPAARMPGARAFLLLRELGRHAVVRGCIPADPATMHEHEMRVFLDDVDDPDELRERVSGMPEVAQIDVQPADGATEQPLSGAAAATVTASAPGVRLAQTVRVEARRLDELMYLTQEVLVARSRLVSMLEGLPPDADRRRAVEELIRHSTQLQRSVMDVRLTPVELALSRLPRLVRDLASRLGKQVKLNMEGLGTEVDRTVVEALADPLVHLVKNAIDHGIEPPEEREAAGKPPQGVLNVGARHTGGQVVIVVRDDGRGIDPAGVASAARQRGLIGADEQAAVSASAERATELLFAPGMSTSAEATEISGRGVGMDAVRTTIRELGGDLWLASEPGKGTTVEMRMPLTLAIMPVLVVCAGDASAAIPIDRVLRVERFEAGRTRRVSGKLVLNRTDADDEGGPVPLVELTQALQHDEQGELRFVVTVRGRTSLFGIAIERLEGQRELVMRPLPAVVRERLPVVGGGLLSSGRIALVLDCERLVDGGELG